MPDDLPKPQEVQIRTVYVWDCPECGRHNTLEISLDGTDACYWCRAIVEPKRG